MPDPWTGLEQTGPGAGGDIDPDQERRNLTAFPGDNLLGGIDEAVGRAVAAAERGDPAGVADAAAGGTDEAVGRAADPNSPSDVVDNRLGDVDDAARRAADAAADGNAGGVVDNLLGGIDEAIARATDPSQPDTVADVARDAAFDEVPGGSPGGDAVDLPTPSVSEAADQATETANEAAEAGLSWLFQERAGQVVLAVGLLVFVAESGVLEGVASG